MTGFLVGFLMGESIIALLVAIACMVWWLASEITS